MLYGEFLRGIGETESPYNYAEYKRIEQIYNNNNEMDKEDAYAMYRKPTAYVIKLEEKCREYKADYEELGKEYDRVNKALSANKGEIIRLLDRIEYLERIIHSAYIQMNN